MRSVKKLYNRILLHRTIPPTVKNQIIGLYINLIHFSGSSSQCGNESVHIPSKYEITKVEKKWQQYWEEKEVFKAERRPNRDKKYILDMFPYPSGSGLHVGHPEGYTASDILSRFYRMQGYDVLHPMGWDAFGLPAEQYAILTGQHPKETTINNIKTFKRQLKMLGFSYDWSREISTTHDDYIKWTQWIFLKLFENNLAEQEEVPVNWCPELGTILSNEEVIDGVSERGGFNVYRIPIRQWILKITKYADQLEQDLDLLNWPKGTIEAQRNWIGKSSGVMMKFLLDIDNINDKYKTIEIFTTRPDTIYGVTYLAISPEHQLVDYIKNINNDEELNNFINNLLNKSEKERKMNLGKEKTGIFTGLYGLHPLTNERIPIYITDYILGNYGTGAIMGVPAHDQRDYEFSIKYNLPIKQVIQSDHENKEDDELPYLDDGILINSSEFNNKNNQEAIQEIIKELENQNLGVKTINYKLHDWIFSRQRYWGEPIPIYFPVEAKNKDTINNDEFNPNIHEYNILYNNPIPVNENELPLKLPEMIDFKPGENPEGCLSRVNDWRFFKQDNKWYARETNTMPQWAGSCWYYMRFADPRNNLNAWSKEADEDWLPVDMYIGGQEHAVLHLLYARFWHKVFYDLNLTKHKEPFPNLVHQGLILGPDGEKMSKSRGNVINPDEIVNEYGADVLRMYLMFMGPFDASKTWQTDQLQGITRFRDRIYKLLLLYISNNNNNNNNNNNQSVDDSNEMDKLIKNVTEHIKNFQFNNAISSLMVYSKYIQKKIGNDEFVTRNEINALLLCLSPFAPHLSEEVWYLLGNNESIALQAWPTYDENKIREDFIIIPIQINGKMKDKINVPKDINEENLMIKVKELSKIQKQIKNQDIKKVIYVKNRIINLVV